jgi:hypothetical protein
MKKNITLFVFASLFMLLFSCKDDESNLILSVHPNNIITYAKLDTIIRFNVNISSTEKISRLQISRDVIGQPIEVLLDSSLNTKNFSYNLDYVVDQSIAYNEFRLMFYAEDDAGSTFTVTRKIIIEDYNYILKETTGHVMYGRLSGKEYAYDLYSGEAKTLDDSTAFLDIIDNTLDTSAVQLSRNWVSNTATEFVVFNEFDYANATYHSAKSGFEAGIKTSTIQNIEIGNIIIAKLDRGEATNFYTVLKLTNIIDNDGIDNDYYQFNLKKK